MSTTTLVTGAALAAASILFFASEAEAQLVIKNPNDHPDYKAELEPHGDLILWHPGYYKVGKGKYYRSVGDVEAGGGFRATIEIVDPVIPKLNNTIGITFGIDTTWCRYCRDDFSLWTPVGVQWNFFLTRKWSVFGDIGFMGRTDSFYYDFYPDFFFMAGGRYHINDDVALTLRIGYPFVSFGASFFVG